jgi:hypothetical protein
MKMTISRFLGWGGKRKADDERRQRPRVIVDEPVRVYWTTGDTYASAAGTLRDVAEDGAGIGFSLRKQLPIGTVAWLTTLDGRTFGGIVRHSDEKAGEFRSGVQLDVRPTAIDGWGGVQTRWIAADGKANVATASLRNSDEGGLQVNATAEAPVGSLLMISGPQVSCLCFVNDSQPYGKRFLLDVTTAADANVQLATQAA